MVLSWHRDRRNSSTFISTNYYDNEENMKNQTMRKMFSTCAINSDNRQFFNFSMFNGHKTYRPVVYFVQNRKIFMHTCTLVKSTKLLLRRLEEDVCEGCGLVIEYSYSLYILSVTLDPLIAGQQMEEAV